MVRPTLGVSINAVVPRLAADHTRLPGLAAAYEAWGADQVVIGEHLLMGVGLPHPGAADVDLMIPWPEPFVALAGIAAVTSRVTLTTGGIIGPTRPAVVIAKQAATLDALSGGRFELGLVAGWFDAEFDATGVPFSERFARTDELVDVCRALWGEQPASFAGRWTSFADVVCSPVPPQGAALPIWFGGRASRPTAKRVVHADGWIVSEAASTDEIREGMDLIRERCTEVGRPHEEVRVRATLPRTLWPDRRTVDQPVEAIGDAGWAALVERVELGVTDICIPIHSWAIDRDAAKAVVVDLVARTDAQLGETRGAPAGRAGADDNQESTHG